MGKLLPKLLKLGEVLNARVLLMEVTGIQQAVTVARIVHLNSYKSRETGQMGASMGEVTSMASVLLQKARATGEQLSLGRRVAFIAE